MGRKPKAIPKIHFDQLDEKGRQTFEKICAEYDKQSIFVLREVARDIGVRSATVMSKALLVEKMAYARMKNTLLYSGQQEEKAEVLIGDNETSLINENSLINDYLQKTFVSDPKFIQGSVFISGDNACLRRYFTDRADNVYMPMRIINDFNLTTGDFITGNGKVISNNRLGVYQVDTINGLPAKKSEKPKIEESFFRRPDKSVKLEGSPQLAALSCLCPFYYGERRLIIKRGAQSLTALASDIITELNKQGVKTFALFLDEQDNAETIINLPGRAQPLFVRDNEKAPDAASFACSCAQKIAAAGQNTVLLINNVDVLDEKTLIRIFDAPRFINNGSLTVVFLCAVLDLEQKINRLGRLADSVAEINKDGVNVVKITNYN